MRTIQDKYVSLYKEFITQLHIYAAAIRVLAKGYLPISLISPLKLKEILIEVYISHTVELILKKVGILWNSTLVLK